MPVYALAVSASPSRDSVALGATAHYTITVTNEGTAADAVTLSAAAVEPNVTTSFSPASVSPAPGGGTATSTLDVEVSSSASPGTVTVALTASGSPPPPAVAPTASATVALDILAPTATFTRALSGKGVTPHGVPPDSLVGVQVATTSAVAFGEAWLADSFPSTWTVVNAGGGTITEAGATTIITWPHAALAANTPARASYTVLSPVQSTPPAMDSFMAGLLWPGGAVSETPWSVMTFDPFATTTYLHAATTSVPTSTVHLINATAPTGTLAELSAHTTAKNAPVSLADASGVTIFASDPVPAGREWNVGGTWNVNLYLRAAQPATQTVGSLTLYRVDPMGKLTPLFHGTSAALTLPLGTTYGLASWSVDVPNPTLVNPLERYAVELGVETSQPGSVWLGLDAPAQASRITHDLVTGTAVDGLRETHARVGQDTPLGSMQWLAPVDAPAAALPVGSNFRVRFQVWNDGAAAQAWQPRLEWAAVAATMAWAAVPTSAGAAPFFTSSTTQYGNGTAIPVGGFALGNGPVGIVPQAGVAYAGANPGGSFSLNGSSYTEVEFNVQATSAAAVARPYAFRLTDNGTLLTSSAVSGEVSVRTPQSPLSPHVTVGQTPDNCGACHRSHTGQGPMLQKFFDDKQVCLSCHDGTGAQPSLSGEFSATSHHPIGTTNSIHRPNEGQSPGWNVGATRHVECMDCHNPHKAPSGVSTPGFGDAANDISGIWGVIPSNSTANGGGVSSFTRTTAVTREYQLCEKCHSSYAYNSTPPTAPSGTFTETDQSKEFNPNNQSYHWVENDLTAASGFTPRTSDPTRVMTFVAGSNMNSSTRLNCTSCHGSATAGDPPGAHGSSSPFILRGSWAPGQQNLCLSCHDPRTYTSAGSEDTPGKTSFSGEKPNLHAFHMGEEKVQANGCQSCHSAIPHGSQNRALLAPITNPRDATNQNSRLSAVRPPNPGTWQQSSCTTSCHD